MHNKYNTCSCCENTSKNYKLIAVHNQKNTSYRYICFSCFSQLKQAYKLQYNYEYFDIIARLQRVLHKRFLRTKSNKWVNCK